MKKKLIALISVPLALCALFGFAGCDVIAAINPDGSWTLTPEDGNGIVTIKPGDNGSQEGDITITPITPNPPPVEELNPNPSDYGSNGLAYTLSNNGEYYIVSGIGTCTETDIVIASVFNDLPVTEIGKQAFSGCDEFTSIDIPDSVISIGKEAFRGCKQLTSIIIPDSVTSIGTFTFSICENLKSATLPKDIKYIPEAMFAYCESLTNITIPESVTSIGSQAFKGCSFTSINIPDKVTSIGFYAFYDCSKLTSITIPDGINLIENSVFYNCSSLTSITIPDGVISIQSKAFYNCSNLSSITIPNGITTMGEGVFYNTPFYNNESNWENGVLYLKNYLIKAKTTLSGNYQIKPGTVLIAGGAFSNCSSLTGITIPDGVVSIGSEDVWSGTGGYSFSSCTELTNITIPESVTYLGDSTFVYCSNLKSVTLSNGIRRIGFEVFWDCSSLESVNIESSFIMIHHTAFEHSGLHSITFDETSGTQVTIQTQNSYMDLGVIKGEYQIDWTTL